MNFKSDSQRRAIFANMFSRAGNVRRGGRFEQKIRSRLDNPNSIVTVRSSGSRSLWDVVCITPDKVRLIQAKTKGYLTPSEREKMLADIKRMPDNVQAEFEYYTSPRVRTNRTLKKAGETDWDKVEERLDYFGKVRGYSGKEEFSFASPSLTESGFMFGDSDYDGEYSRRSLPQPGLQPDNKCQGVLTTHMDKEEYDVDDIPKKMLDVLGMSREEAKDVYEKYGIRLEEKKGRFSLEPGDRVLKLGNENIDYGLHAGIIKEIKEGRALIRFDDTGKEIWYPGEMIYTQKMLDEDLKK